MEFFLRLKHWQLFFLTWGIPLVIDIYSFSDPMLLLKLFPVMMILFIFNVFGWIWSISNVLNRKLPATAKLKLRYFNIILSIPMVYIIGILAWMNYQFFEGSEGSGNNLGLASALLIIILSLGSMVCIFLALRFAAKTMKSVEMGRLAKFNDYAGEFFLIWFLPVGIWILQPRLNKIVEHSTSPN